MSLDFDRAQRVVRSILTDAGYSRGSVELVALEPEPMRLVNVEFLGHDYPTDVLAFALEDDRDRGAMTASIIICPEVALQNARLYNWRAEDEATLYFAHGALHLVGYDDHAAQDAPIMHAKEVEYLARVGVDASRARDGE